MSIKLKDVSDQKQHYPSFFNNSLATLLEKYKSNLQNRSIYDLFAEFDEVKKLLIGKLCYRFGSVTVPDYLLRKLQELKNPVLSIKFIPSTYSPEPETVFCRVSLKLYPNALKGNQFFPFVACNYIHSTMTDNQRRDERTFSLESFKIRYTRFYLIVGDDDRDLPCSYEIKTGSEEQYGPFDFTVENWDGTLNTFRCKDGLLDKSLPF